MSIEEGCATCDGANEVDVINNTYTSNYKNLSENIIKTDITEFIRFYDIVKESVENPFLLLLKHNSKDPIDGVSWKNNKVTYAMAISHMKLGGNIGIAATENDKLVIMDKDDIEAVGETKHTLTCTSRKRIGEHCFYVTDETPYKSIFDNTAKMNMATEEAGEIRAVWQYVVAAGSYVPVTDKELEVIPAEDKHNAGKYSITKADKITSITYAEIPEVYRNSIEAKRTIETVRAEKVKNVKKTDHSSCNTSALYDIDMSDVIGHVGREGKRFASPFHGSDTGKNTSISGNLVNCWRHNVTHTPLTALAIMAGVGGCAELGYGHGGHGVSGLDLDDGKTVMTMWTYAKERGIIPDDDPIPTRALIHYALENKLCRAKDIKNGWMIPHSCYKTTLMHMDYYGIKHGRKI